MIRWFSLLLLVGALFGLLGQEAAFAQTIFAKRAAQTVTAVQMPPECAAMMELAKPPPQPDMPCPGMTRDCAAKMGCAVTLAVFEPFTLSSAPQLRAAAPPRAPVSPLIGRDTGPEPEPPAHFG